MLVIPAIDLRGGRCVRLYQGDYARETVVGDDPVAMARHWQAAGARLLHVVDLDGARAGRPVQLDLVGRICAALAIPVELGGGLRTAGDVAAALAAGVARVILGTAALEEPALVTALLARHGPECIVLGLDARDGRVASRGWLATSEVAAVDLARAMAAAGVRTVVYTDIGRDGTLTGPNVAATAALARASGLAVIASGGVSGRADLAALAAEPGIAGVIVGRALYTGDLRLAADEWVWDGEGRRRGDARQRGAAGERP
jgi:phosphoribosylformimino-5-aminoimidazole carboxamide ribotide isomerase